MNVLDLFSGIGGFSLGLERAGMRTVAFCEIDPFCRRVLAKRWPEVPCADDITTMDFKGLNVDVICGGFPCQDISVAGNGAGLAGARSGLWRDMVRAIRLVRPRHAIVENVAALLGRGMGTVLGDLAEIGHDAEWHCIPASSVGAPHRRDRVWIVASDAARRRNGRDGLGEARGRQPLDPSEDLDAADTIGHELRFKSGRWCGPGGSGEAELGDDGAARPLADTDDQGQLQSQWLEREEWRRPSDGRWWSVEPDVGRVAHGVPARVDRLRSLGNAVVPQIPEIIGRAILAAQESR